jgi:YVTN family beta-propeller protein
MRAHEVAVSADGKTAYLPVYGDTGLGTPGTDGRELLFADLPSRRITGSVDFGRAVRPHFPVVRPKTGLVYVTTELDKSVTIIDPKSRSIVGRIQTGAEQSHMLALSRDGRFGYTANFKPGSVSVLDLKARKLVAIIPVAETVQRIAVSADDRLVFTSDNQLPRLAVIDTVTRKVRQWIALPDLGGGTSATPDGRWLLIAIRRRDQVAVVDLQTMRVARTIAVGKSPAALVVQPDQRIAYVSCAGDGSVSAIDLASWKVIRTVPTAPGADGIAWTNP